jgi:hypothetical protein
VVVRPVAGVGEHDLGPSLDGGPLKLALGRGDQRVERLQVENGALRETVSKQSAVLDTAYAQVRVLERRLAQRAKQRQSRGRSLFRRRKGR